MLAPAAPGNDTSGPAPPNILVFFADDLDFDQVNAWSGAGQPSYTAAHRAGLFPPADSSLRFERPEFLMPHLDRRFEGPQVFDSPGGTAEAA